MYCKNYNCKDCHCNFCSVTNIIPCPYLVATEEEIQKMKEEYEISSLITQEVLDSYGGSMTIEEANEYIKRIRKSQ